MDRRRRILQVFNRYLQHGGEEDAVNRFTAELGQFHELTNCFFESADWKKPGGPSTFRQAGLMFYNPESAATLREAIARSRPDCILLHNLYPVGSPSLYRAALKAEIPVVQYIHNFRPFSVGGTLWAKGVICEESLKGNYLREVRLGAWQHSVLKSALFATMLTFLHRSGWLRAVKGWIAISEFMRQKFIGAGIDPAAIHTLKHACEPRTPRDEMYEDRGYYLFLGRLVGEKGIRVMVEAWDIVVAELGSAAPELVICGTGDLAAYVEAAAERNARLRYAGFVSGKAKAEIIRECRAMLAPSTCWEALGLVTYDAYDYKKPMLAADTGGLSETVLPGETGFLHERGSAQALARDVIACEGLDAGKRTMMGRAGRRWLDENTSPQQWRIAFNTILDRIGTP